MEVEKSGGLVAMSSIVVNEICAMDIKNRGKTKENTVDMYVSKSIDCRETRLKLV